MFKTRDTRRLYAGDSPGLRTVIPSSGARRTKWVSLFLMPLGFPVIASLNSDVLRSKSLDYM